MKYCTKCGAEIKEGADVCVSCGTLLHKSTTINTKIDGSILAGFILSLVGILVYALPCGILAVIFCSMGMKKAKETGKGKGFAIAGIVIGIFCVLAGFYNIFSVI